MAFFGGGLSVSLSNQGTEKPKMLTLFGSAIGSTLPAMLLEFQTAVKQNTAKPIVDYFQRVCDATIMHESKRY